MRRREFIVLLSGAVALPPVARAQQPEPMRRIGVLIALPEDDPEAKSRVEALQTALQNLGWIAGRSIRIDYRWGTANPKQATANAKELIDLKPEVIVVQSTPGVAALLRETRTIPIVFLGVADPMGSGFIESMPRPGGNITGFSNFDITMAGKWLELLKEISPAMRRSLVLVHPESTPDLAYLRAAETAASSMALQLVPARLQESANIEIAIKGFAQDPSGGLVVLPDIFMTVHRRQIISLAAKYQLPAVYGFRLFVTEGGLISYGVNPLDEWRQAPSYVDRILHGEKPHDLPVQAPTKFELVINLKTAKVLGLTIPPSLLALADEVIDGSSVARSCCECSGLLVALFPRSLRCGDRVWLQDYFCRARQAASTALDGPTTDLPLCDAAYPC
jgi:putative tryptophan/tyrosine transport system substrate-binding protein